MKEEKRKFFRSKCFLPAELIKLEGKPELFQRMTAHNFSQEGLIININLINMNPGSNMELKIYLPEKKLFTLLSAEIAWTKFINRKLEVGLKIKHMDKAPKEDILNWVSPKWIIEGTQSK